MADNTATLHILEQPFTVTMPFVEGHVCTAAEAKVLNQTRRENLGNNFRSKVKDALDSEKELTMEQVQAEFAKADAEYVFTLANVGGGRGGDPVEKEAKAMAREMLKAHLAKTGRKLTGAPDGETEESWKEKVAAEIERIAGTEDVMAAAKKQVEAKKKATDKLAESVGLSA